MQTRMIMMTAMIYACGIHDWSHALA